MTRNELVHKAQVKLEELTPYGYEGSLIAIREDNELTENINEDIKPIVSYINENLEEACNTILGTLPLHLINPTDYTEDAELHPDLERGTGRISLPYDFLRLHSFRMQGWWHDVTTAITFENPAYQIQRNIHTMGKPSRPTVTIDKDGLDKWLEYYSVYPKDEHVLEKFCYVAKFNDRNIQANLAPYYALQTAINVSNILALPIGKQLQEELNELIKQHAY